MLPFQDPPIDELSKLVSQGITLNSSSLLILFFSFLFLFIVCLHPSYYYLDLKPESLTPTFHVQICSDLHIEFKHKVGIFTGVSLPSSHYSCPLISPPPLPCSSLRLLFLSSCFDN